MGFWNRRRGENRSLPPAENQLPLLAAYAGQPVNTTTALAIADVWAPVRVLADAAVLAARSTSTARPATAASESTGADWSTSSRPPGPRDHTSGSRSPR